MAVKVPAFTYTGSYTTELRDDGYWYIFFKTSGTLKMSYGKTADLYLHGGGGGGAGGGWNASGGGGGAGGYLANHYGIDVEAGTPYDIVIGAGGSGGVSGGSSVGSNGDGKPGGASSAFGYSVDGGGGAEHMGEAGVGGSGNGGYRGQGVGGRGGDGGSNSVYAFDSATGLLYGGGGSGGQPESGGDGSPGLPYGAAHDTAAAANTGAGGAGGGFEDKGYAGGSGIVILRGHQDDYLPVMFNRTTLQRMFFNGNEVRHLYLDDKKLFAERIKEWLKPKMRSALPVV